MEDNLPWAGSHIHLIGRKRRRRKSTARFGGSPSRRAESSRRLSCDRSRRLRELQWRGSGWRLLRPSHAFRLLKKSFRRDGAHGVHCGLQITGKSRRNREPVATHSDLQSSKGTLADTRPPKHTKCIATTNSAGLSLPSISRSASVLHVPVTQFPRHQHTKFGTGRILGARIGPKRA